MKGLCWSPTGITRAAPLKPAKLYRDGTIGDLATYLLSAIDQSYSGIISPHKLQGVNLHSVP